MTVAQSQCLSTPPYFVAAAFMYGVAWAGDKYRIRGPLLLINCALGLIGLPILVCPFCPADLRTGVY